MNITRHSTNLLLTACIAAAGAALPASARAQCADWRTETGLRAVGIAQATQVWDPDGNGPQAPVLVVGGSFDHAGGVNGISVANIATWNGSTWSAMPGFPGTIIAFAVLPNGDLVAGGSFDIASGAPANNIARWTGTSWVPLGTGMNGDVYALAVMPSGDLVAGGPFTVAGGVTANRIARWNGTSWSAFPNGGMNGQVNTLTIHQGTLIAGGYFTSAGGSLCNYVARWSDGPSVFAWLPLGSGLNDAVWSAASMPNGDLVVGGDFSTAGGASAIRTARWNGSSWLALGSGMSSRVQVLRVLTNGDLVAAGYFTTAGGSTANHIARWTGTGWVPLGVGTSAIVLALTEFNGELIVGGRFSSAGGFPVESLARWNGNAWLDTTGVMLTYSPSWVKAITPWAGGLILGGKFTTSTVDEFLEYNLAWWNGTNLQSIGQPSDEVRAATTAPGAGNTTDLFIGGNFSTIDSITCNHVAKRNDMLSPNWQTMGAGFNNSVLALTLFGGRIYAGGVFTASGGTALNYIASWDSSSSTWQPVGPGPVTGVDFLVRAMKGFNVNFTANLVVGGDFSNAGGVAANRIANYKVSSPPVHGDGWSAMGQGFNSVVYAVERYNGSTYAAGLFTASGATTLNHIARWNGTAWVDVGGGTNGEIDAMTVSNGTLVVGGAFSTAGGVTANRLARWNGSSWSEIGGGVTNGVYTLGTLQNEIQVGGPFITVRNATLESPSWARFAENGAPWVADQPESQTVGCGTTATLSIQPAQGYSGLSYQWRKNATPIIPGPTGTGSTITSNGASLSISNVSEADEATYDCVLSNTCGSSTSSGATLTVSGGAGGDGDGDGNGVVNGADLAGFIIRIQGGSFGRGVCAYDMNADGLVDMTDLPLFVARLLNVGTNWSQRFSVPAPSPRDGHAMAYDSGRGVTVLFSGYTDAGAVADTWEFNGASWSQRFPASAPPPDYTHSMAYDAGRGVTVLLTRVPTTYTPQTWEWDGTNWTQRFSLLSPLGRDGSAMAYDSARGVTVLFGGYTGAGPDAQTWEWNGTNWSQRSPATSPSARYNHAMVYDSGRGVTVLFGGLNTGNFPNSETWEWNGTNWSQRAPATAPFQRDSHKMAYDTGRGVTVLFGGFNGRDETWEWNGTNWSQRSPPTFPTGRLAHAMAYDAARGVTVLFGGLAGSPLSLNGETWEWKGGN